MWLCFNCKSDKSRGGYFKKNIELEPHKWFGNLLEKKPNSVFCQSLSQILGQVVEDVNVGKQENCHKRGSGFGSSSGTWSATRPEWVGGWMDSTFQFLAGKWTAEESEGKSCTMYMCLCTWCIHALKNTHSCYLDCIVRGSFASLQQSHAFSCYFLKSPFFLLPLSEHLFKVYLISSCVWRVTDLCCDYSRRKNRTLRWAAFALQKCGDRALLRVPDGIIPYRKEIQQHFSSLREWHGIFIVAKQLVLTTVTHLMSWREQFLTHQLSCCHRWVAGQLLRPSVMWDFGQPAGSLHCQTPAADVLHTGRNRPLLQNRFWFSSEQRSVHTHRWRGAACLKREFKFDPIVTDSSIWTETQTSQSFPSATGSISFTQEEQ